MLRQETRKLLAQDLFDSVPTSTLPSDLEDITCAAKKRWLSPISEPQYLPCYSPRDPKVIADLALRLSSIKHEPHVNEILQESHRVVLSPARTSAKKKSGKSS